jgi:AmmeMemoRadiSam system protein A
MAEFRFSLSEEEKTYLKELARLAILRRLKPGEAKGSLPEPPTDKLREQFGAFVCLKCHGRLRGCIGHIVGDKPLHKTIAEMAQAAAFGDPRFAPVCLDESGNLEIEISILSPLTPCPDLERIEIGRHGLLVQQGGRQGLLLPQVATEWGWDRETLLKQTCLKAGLSGDCYRRPETTVFWFEAEVF